MPAGDWDNEEVLFQEFSDQHWTVLGLQNRTWRTKTGGSQQENLETCISMFLFVFRLLWQIDDQTKEKYKDRFAIQSQSQIQTFR